MDDLVQFLRDRLNEDEQAAFEAGDGSPDQWTFAPKLVWNGPDGPREAVVHYHGSAMGYVAVVDPVHGKYGTWAARHIARHDPARVLREVEAKRQMIRLHVCAEGHECSTVDDPCTWIMESEACTTLRLLALPYSDHPDYREDWRP